MSQGAPTDRDRAAQTTEAGGGEVDWGLGMEPGSVLGDRYRIKSLLGAGGMGEVWRAFDLKLRVEVALKALRPELFRDESRRELLRKEVRTAREVVSPNVCRIFDLIEADGSELVSMEYVDGATLLAVLQERGPLELKEAQDIASQFLAGLEAIHKAGLVHRDVKPENIMLTRASRVVLMDFGLARQEAEGGGSVSGTPAYMAPEQARGEVVDARADVYAAGVVLAEMVSQEGTRDIQSRQTLWEGIRHDPPRMPDSPWAPVLKKAVAREPDRRFNSAHTLTRALEDVTLRVEGAEDLTPYPGLASFTAEDAEFFFGREAEVEQMWRKLEGSPRLLAIVGPSGAGKTSFIRAGLMPNASPGWATVRCTPGEAAIPSLARAMAREMAGDADAVELVVDIHDPAIAVKLFSHWRERHDQVLLIVDQFEELFTLNPPQAQAAFSDLLGRLPLESDVHVVLSMRDDFATACNAHEALRPIFHELTVLDPPSGTSLRRALVQPATKCGYRFEDDALVAEMLAEVEGERGALPMLAFAVARLWKNRDREAGLLTRQAYHDIGGVGGALARHAEATIDRIGADPIPVVRELFRNLVTAEGTRAVREWGELLSVFDGDNERTGMKPAPTGFTPARQAAEEVLRELIDARLLTSYEVHGEGEQPTRRVEIIHESLLASWPRLVRWQTQDADAAQFRDQLRQAARTWQERDRPDDLLWTGTAFREYALWRERYPGGLTALEEDFARAMISLANRRKRRRRLAVATALLLAAAVAAVTTTLWRRSVLEARRADASRLLALTRLELDADQTASLAWATASLELADSVEARLFALEALWRGPTHFVLPVGKDRDSVLEVKFNPDGQLFAAAAATTDEVFVWSQSGQGPDVLGEGSTPHAATNFVAFDATGEILVSGWVGACRLWSVPDFELIRELDLSDGLTIEERPLSYWELQADRLWTYTPKGGRSWFRSWPLDGGTPEDLGWLDTEGITLGELDPTGASLLVVRGGDAYLRPLDSLESAQHDLLVARHPSDILWCRFTPTGEQFACLDESGETRFWSMDPDPEHPLRMLRGQERRFWLDPTVSLLVDLAGGSGYRVWSLSAPPDAEPLVIGEPPGNMGWETFHPSGRWFTHSANDRIFFWPLGGPFPWVLRGHTGPVTSLAFTRDGEQLVSASDGDQDSTVRLWPLSPGVAERGRVLWEGAGISCLAPDPTARDLLVSTFRSDRRGVFLVPMTQSRPTGRNIWPTRLSSVWPVRFSLDGRFAAAGALGADSDEAMVIRVWDLETNDEQVLALRDAVGGDERGFYHRGVGRLRFTSEGDLLSSGLGGVRRWDLETGEGQWLMRVPEKTLVWMDASRDGRFLLTAVVPEMAAQEGSNLTLHDLAEGTSHPITSHSEPIKKLALDATGFIVVTTTEAVIRVGRADGSEPHLLFGHEGDVTAIAISPDGRWIATGGHDTTVRLWPMPDVSKPPLHTLPRHELIAKLKTFTNLRVVRDEESPTGWKVEIGPFPGWETVPTR